MHNVWHPSRCWTHHTEMTVQKAQQVTSHEGLRLLSVPHPISDLIFALAQSVCCPLYVK